MATITGTEDEKVDQITQLFLALQAQVRVVQWLIGIFIPVLILFASWLALTATSTKVEIVALQGKVDLANQRMDQVDKRMDQVDKRMDQMEKTLAKMDAKLDKIDDRLNKIEDRLGKLEDHVSKLEKAKP